MAVNVGDLVATLRLDVTKTSSAFQAVERDAQRYSATMVSAGSRAEQALTTSADRIERAQQAAGDEMRKLYGSHLPSLSRNAEEANVALTNMGLGGSTLSRALGFLVNPLTLVAAGIGAATAAAYAGIKAFSDNASEVKQLIAVSGLSAEAADNLADTMKVLGVDAGTLTTALFKLGNEVDSGGQSLAKFGINILTTTGQLKEPGDLLLEVRNRVSQMGDAGSRSAALMDIFGRAGRTLAPIFALNREEFEKWAKVAGEASPWSEKHQQSALEYQKTMELLKLTWAGFAEALGFAIAGPLMAILGFFTAAIKGAQDFGAALRLAGEQEIIASQLTPRARAALELSGVAVPGEQTATTSLSDRLRSGASPRAAGPSRLSVPQILAPLAIPKEQFTQGALGITAYAEALSKAIGQLSALAATDVEAAKALTGLRKEYEAITITIAGPLGTALDDLDAEFKDAAKTATDRAWEDYRKEQDIIARGGLQWVDGLSAIDEEFKDVAKAVSDRAFEDFRKEQDIARRGTLQWTDGLDDLDAEFKDAARDATVFAREQDKIAAALRGVTGVQGANTKALEDDTKQRDANSRAAENNAAAVARAAQQSAKESGNFFAFVKASLQEQAILWPSTWDSIKSFTVSTFQNVSRSLSDVFFNVFTGQVTSMKDVWEGFMNSMLRAVSDFMAQAVVREFLGLLFGGGNLGGGSSGILGSLVGGLAGLLGNIFHQGGTVGGAGVQPALLQGGEVVVSSAVAQMLGLPQGTGITEAFLSTDAVQNAITSTGLRDLFGIGGTGSAGADILRSAGLPTGAGGGGIALEGAALLNTEFLGSTPAGSALPGLGPALSIAGIAMNLFNAAQAFASGNKGAGFGGLGGMAAGAFIGNLLFPGLGGILGGAALGGGIGGFLGGLGFGPGTSTAHRKAREKAEQTKFAADALIDLRSVVAGGFDLAAVKAYMSNPTALSNQGFTPGVTGIPAEWMSSVWAVMVRTMLNAGEGQFLLSKFHPDIVRGFEAEIGSFQGPSVDIQTGGDGGTGGYLAPGPTMQWVPELNRWLALPAGASGKITMGPGGIPGVWETQWGETFFQSLQQGIPGLEEGLVPLVLPVPSKPSLDRARLAAIIGVSPDSLPAFAAGGIVPGPVGAPQLAVVHGGEEVVPTSGRGGGSTLVVKVMIGEREIGEAVVRDFERRALSGQRFLPDEARVSRHRS